MADQRITDLTALTGANTAPDDLFVLVDVSDTTMAVTGTDKSITRQEFQTYNAGTLTTDVKVLDLSATWNNAAVPFTGIKINATSTASAAASLLMDLQVGGTSKFKVDKAGAITIADAGRYALAFGPNAFIGRNNNDILVFTSGSVDVFAVNQYSSTACMASDISLSWSSTGDVASNSNDLFLHRDAANTLALRNSTNAQTFNIYNTYTDASNYERASLKFASNVMTLSMDAAGTGTKRDFTLDISGSTAKGITLKTDASGYLDYAFASTISQRFSTTGQYLQATQKLFWSPTTVTVGLDCSFGRTAAGILAIQDGSTGGATLQMTEQTAPAAPATNSVRIYAQDNGAGKTQLMALFASGAAQQIAIEP